jgi:hypothetical protein
MFNCKQICQDINFPVYSSTPIRPMGERAAAVVEASMAPPKAQNPQSLRLKNYWYRQIWRELFQQPPKGHSTQVVISQVTRTDGAQQRGIPASLLRG